MFSFTAMLTGDIFQKTLGEIFASHINNKTTANERYLLDTKHKQEPLPMKYKAQLTETNGALQKIRTARLPLRSLHFPMHGKTIKHTFSVHLEQFHSLFYIVSSFLDVPSL